MHGAAVGRGGEDVAEGVDEMIVHVGREAVGERGEVWVGFGHVADIAWVGIVVKSS
jgi:hypothetical protein